jgi:hypothetical protein
VKMGPIALPYYFVLVNVATAAAFIKFMRGEAHIIWEPVRDTRQQPVNVQSESFSEARP